MNIVLTPNNNQCCT